MSIRNSCMAIGRNVGLASILVTSALATLRAAADINLEFRPSSQAVCVGDTVSIGLYAVSDDVTDQLLSAAQVILSWDSAVLQLVANDNTGAVPLLFSGFPSDPYGLNEVVPPKDGDGLYVALAQPGNPVAASPQGVLLTTFQFQALAETPKTPVDILEFGGDPVGETIVFDGTVPNFPVTGTLSGAVVEILPATCPADLDCDGTVDIADLLTLLAGWGSDPGAPPDFDGDGTVGILDLLMLLANWGPCP